MTVCNICFLVDYKRRLKLFKDIKKTAFGGKTVNFKLQQDLGIKFRNPGEVCFSNVKHKRIIKFYLLTFIQIPQTKRNDVNYFWYLKGILILEKVFHISQA